MSALTRLGIPLSTEKSISYAQQQTDSAFGFKWSKRDTYESEASQRNTRNWLMERYCSNNVDLLDQWLDGERKIILDAGCGAGNSGLLFFGKHLLRHDYLGVDISSSVEVARQRFEEANIPGDFFRGDISSLDIPDDSVDIIFSEGVLHHTDCTESTLSHLTSKLKPGGRFLFYVYKKKAVVREFTDDAIRASIEPLSDEEAWESLKSLTSLGITLGKANCYIDIEEPIPLLGIEPGRIDIQRFFYWNICKAFYNPELTFDEMHHINYDWYRPLNCHRHTPSEVQSWCYKLNLTIENMDIGDSGITVVATKSI